MNIDFNRIFKPLRIGGHSVAAVNKYSEDHSHPAYLFLNKLKQLDINAMLWRKPIPGFPALETPCYSFVLSSHRVPFLQREISLNGSLFNYWNVYGFIQGGEIMWMLHTHHLNKLLEDGCDSESSNDFVLLADIFRKYCQTDLKSLHKEFLNDLSAD